MDVLGSNREAWSRIGERVTSPYLASPVFHASFTAFCNTLPENAKVLDAGCGPGLASTQALVDRGFTVTGIDLSESMIDAARRNVPAAQFRVLSMTDIDYAHVFDGMVANYSMLCLNPDLFRRAARRMALALKPQGLLFVALNEGDAGTNDDAHWSTILGERMYSRPYSEPEVREAFAAASLNVIRVERDAIKTAEYGTERSLILWLQA